MKKLDKLMDRKRGSEEKISAFGDLLEDLTSTEEKKKALWREIYENAVSDRERASILFTDAFKSMGTTASEHVTLGSVMSKYLERMCKSNEQILNLASLIAKAEQADQRVNPDEIFSKISEG